jgi:hypothetical protein
MNLTVARNELKYFVSEAQCLLLADKLQHILTKDQYSAGKGYFIRSLYFDSHDDECLHEKQSGTMFRAKYRMRIYDCNTKKVKFEIKYKCNNQIYKETATISKESAEKIIDGDYGELLKYKNPILNKIYIKFVLSGYKPKVVVDYHREAYLWSLFNIRITFDRDLRCNNNNYNIFSSNLFTTPAILEKKQILEIKYDRILPDYIRDSLQIESFDRSAISKYNLGRGIFRTEVWQD